MTSYLLLKNVFVGSTIFAAIGAFPFPIFIAILIWLISSRIMGKNARKGLYLTLSIGLVLLILYHIARRAERHKKATQLAIPSQK